MKINENELNYILNECVKTLLKEEDFDDAAYTAPKKTFTDADYQKKVVKPNGFHQGNSTRRKVVAGAKEAGKYGGAMVKNWYTWGLAMNILQSYCNPLGTATSFAQLPMLSKIFVSLGYGGVAVALIRQIMKTKQSMDRAKQMDACKLPDIEKDLEKYATEAASELVAAQKNCLESKENLLNTIGTYNELTNQHLTFNYVLQTIMSQNPELSTFKSTNVNGGPSTQQLNIKDIDFTDKNAGQFENRKAHHILESLINEDNVPNDEYDTYVEPIGDDDYDYPNDNDDKNTNNDTSTQEEAYWKPVYIAGKTYLESYQVWMQWARYTQALIKKFPKELDWNKVINFEVKKPGYLRNLLKKLGKAGIKYVFGIEGFSDDVKKRFSKEKSTEETSETEILLVKNNSWEYTTKNKWVENLDKGSGVLLYSSTHRCYFCIKHNDYTTKNITSLFANGNKLTCNTIGIHDVTPNNVYDYNQVSGGENAVAVKMLKNSVLQHIQDYEEE